MLPGFDSRSRCHMWVEFVVGSRPCSERFFSGYSGFPFSSKTNTYKIPIRSGAHEHVLRLLRTFVGVLREKIHMRAILNENTAYYISLESLINLDFGKKYKLPVSSISQKKSKTTTKMTKCHSIELIGYQIKAHWQNNCTVLITKDQSSKVCQPFSIC